jgi:hypothetical protein
MATVVYSVESDDDDEEHAATTPEKKKGKDRLQYMSANRDLCLDVAQAVIDIGKKNGTQADSQDVCNMIDEMKRH